VDSHVVKPKDWWERARTALVTAAAVADTWPQMVSRQLAKLQVRATAPQTAESVEIIGKQFVELGPAAWSRFRALCERDALYIVAMAQAASSKAKKERKSKSD